VTLIEQATQLRAEVAEHKAEIGRRRRRLKAAKSALARIEADCQRHGIRFVIQERTDGPHRTDRPAD
jgi:hypothetical protein